MRNYQILTLIGCILGILIAFSFYVFLSAFDAGLSSFEENLGDTETYPSADRQIDLAQIGGQAGIAILLMIIAIILVFVLPRQTKLVGIYLIVLSFIVLIAMGLFGILPFALFLPAGIVALRYKNQNILKSYPRDDDDDGRIYSGGGGGSPIK